MGENYIMVIDKNLLSKKSGQESADELFGQIKADLIRINGELGNIVANNQSDFVESIDDCVHTILNDNNSHGKANSTIVFKAKFLESSSPLLKANDNVSFRYYLGAPELKYYIPCKYRYSFDKDTVSIVNSKDSGTIELIKNCKKYINNSITFKDIDTMNTYNALDFELNIYEHLVKAANDFSRLVVAYLAKQGIKSRANQTNNEVTVVIERDTDTGGFEDI